MGCTQPVANEFNLAQVTNSFNATSVQNVNTKLDILFMVDNSSSMDPSQDSLRQGFASFAQQYMLPTWDIQVGVITSDTYLGNPVYTNYVESDGGAHPKWGSSWGQLLDMNHDGPMTAICNSNSGLFYSGFPQCSIRDGGSATGVANCINPPSGDTAVTQCVNTNNNDTIHSHLPVISTMPPAGTPGNAAWITQLTDNFITNVSTGSAGSGIERGLGSVLELMQDNEVPGAQNRLFRPGSLRVIVVISDEEDQTIDLTPLQGTQVNPGDGYYFDPHYTGTTSGNPPTCPTRSVLCTPGMCTGAINPAIPSGQSSLNIPGSYVTQNGNTYYQYTLSYCSPNYATNSSLGVNGDTFMPVATIKSKFDTFFTNLDTAAKSGNGTPNYFFVSIVPTTGEAIHALHVQRGQEQQYTAGIQAQFTSDIGQRYMSFGNLVGNGSFASNLVNASNVNASTDFGPILNSIGQVIVQKKAVFQLSRAPAANETVLVNINHQNGTSTAVQSSQFTVSGTTLTLTDQSLVLSLTSTDQVSINYKPATAY
jgi:hypothetical protein